MAVLTVQNATRESLVLTDALVAAGVSGDSWGNTGTEYLAVNNGAGSSITVTLVYQRQFDEQTASNRTVVVAAGKLTLIGPFPQHLYNASNQRASVTYSSVTSVTVAAIRMGA